MNIAHTKIKSDVEKSVEVFLKGEIISDPYLLKSVIEAIDPSDSTPYQDTVNEVKDFINCCKKEFWGNLYLFNNDQKLTIRQKAVFVRMVNLSHKGNCEFVILNEEIIFHHEYYDNFSVEEIKNYVRKSIGALEHYKAENKLRSNIRKFFQFDFVKAVTV